jgi:hypothetical protein
MLDKLKGAFGIGGPETDVAMSAENSDSVDESQDDDESSDDESSVDESSVDEEENGIDFEKLAEEIQTLREKYQKLK